MTECLIGGEQLKKPVLQACFFYFMTGFFGKMYNLKHDRKPKAETLPLFVIRSAVLQTLPHSPSSCF